MHLRFRPDTRPFDSVSPHPVLPCQVLHLAATIAPNQDVAFMLGIAWTAVNLLMSNFFISFNQMTLRWISQVAVGVGVVGWEADSAP